MSAGTTSGREGGDPVLPPDPPAQVNAWPFVSGPTRASATPPSAITIAIDARGAMIPFVDASRAPKITGPRIAVTFPTPSAIPNPVARYSVGKSSLVYG